LPLALQQSSEEKILKFSIFYLSITLAILKKFFEMKKYKKYFEI